MARSQMWALVVLGLLAMVQQSMQFSLKNPLPFKPREIRDEETSALGLITTSKKAEKALNDTGLFSVTASTVISGRHILVGTVYGTPVVLIRTSSSPAVHVGITVQILASNFNIRGIVHFGTAGASNNTFKLGAVSIPARVVHTGVWTWLDKGVNAQGKVLEVKRFNVDPANGDNLLGSIQYNEVDIYYKNKIIESFEIYPAKLWLVAANRLKTKLDYVLVGFNHSSSDIYVKNPAYREFLYKAFRVSTVDTSSSAAGLAAKSNTLNFISLVGVSNYAGYKDQTASALANKNVANAVIGFIWEITVPRSEVVYA